ncbi:MAG: hypothetical protein CVU56_00790 [Deltaproteobacteria bacterium HGW-Deltaproteobacteria-14]|jgi:NTE family protein|nr:MAG: hypothetical protein CVU56_00790 [Deltaproteobacteria bacterium HGW-Deltaproteobacteria-14]
MNPTPTDLSALPRPVALVLSGGVSLGALQVGQLRAVAETGLTPDLIVGTSVGAINSLFMARDFTPERAHALAAVWRGLRREHIFGGVGLGSLLALLKGRGTLASSAGLEALIARELPRDRGELAIPAHVVAVELLSGQGVILSAGDLHRNALASAAIPSVFPPVTIDGRLLVDGGLSANVPLLPAARLGARTLIVLDAGYPCGLKTPPRGLVAGVVHAMTLALRSQVHAALPAVARECVVVYLPAPCPLSAAPHDFSRTAELMTTGYELAREFLSRLVAAGPGVYGHPHFHAEGAV